MKNRKLRGKIIEKFGTASDFANHLGVRDDVVSRVVCGRRSLPPDEVTRWASALNTTPQDLGFLPGGDQAAGGAR
jgi:plasmid maintenance system antidote protein VapI